MRSIKYFFILILLLLFQNNLTAQGAWTLQQCIDYALENNIQVRQSQLNTELSSIAHEQQVTNFFPTFNGSVSHNYYTGRTIDPYTNLYTDEQVQSNSFSVNSNITLFEGLRLQNSLKESKLNYLGSQNDLKKVKNDISLNVVTNYLQVLYNQENLKYTKDQVDATRVQLGKISRMFELGSASKGSKLDMEAQLAADEVRLVQAQASTDQSMLALTQLLEMDTVKGFSIVKPDVSVLELTNLPVVDEVYATALKTQPEIKSSEYKVLSAEKGLSIARGEYYPRLYLGGSVGTNHSTSNQFVSGYVDGVPTSYFSGYTSGGDSVFLVTQNRTPKLEQTPFKDQFNNNLGKSVGFSLQIPILNAWTARHNVARAKINLSQARLNHELTYKNLYKSIQQAVADVNAAAGKYKANQRSISSQEESMNYNQQRYDLGLISSYDYLQSKNNLAKAQADFLQSKYDYIFRMKIIDFYLGKPLSF